MQNQHTWKDINSTWNHGITKPIRVPRILAKRVIRYARALDAGTLLSTQQMIEEFIEIKRHQGDRLPQRFFTMDSPQWRVFNEFYRWTKWKESQDRKEY